MTKTMKYVWLAGSALALSACSTISNVTDAINPFSGGEVDQGEVAGQEDRLSILTLEDDLTVDSSITPDQVQIPGAYVNEEWPQVGGYPSHAMQTTEATGPLRKAWTKDIGKGSGRKTRVVAPPVVWGGLVFAKDGRGEVTAMDERSGDRRWSYEVPALSKRDKEALGGGLSVGEGKLFVTSGFGYVIALDAQSGREIWRTKTRTPVQSAAAYSEGRIFVVTDDNELVAMDASNGDVLWNYQGIVESARMLTTPSPAVTQDVVVAPFGSGEIVALRAQNGGVLWSEALTSAGRLTPLSSLNDIPSGPVVADGYVLASSQSGVLSAFDFRTGQRVWSQPAGSTSFPWIAGEFVYTVTVDGQVACLSRADGTVVWIQQLQAFKNEKKRKNRIAWSGPVMAGERLVLVSSRGLMVELSPYNGQIMNETKLGDDVFIAPIVANQTVYVLTDDAKLIALR